MTQQRQSPSGAFITTSGGAAIIQASGFTGNMTGLSGGQYGYVDVVWDGIDEIGPAIIWASWGVPIFYPGARPLALLDAWVQLTETPDTVRVRFLAQGEIASADVVFNLAAVLP